MASAIGAALGTTITGFFGVPVFYAIGVVLLMDFITGLYKAKVTKKMKSGKFSVAIERAVFYFLLYIPLHSFSLIGGGFLDLLDDGILGMFLCRELLSIVENLKVISVAKGRPSPILDKIIDYIGMDLPVLLEEALPGFNKHNEKKDSQDNP